MKYQKMYEFATKTLAVKNMLYVPEMKEESLENASLPYGFDCKLMELGYTLSDDAFKALFNVNDEVLGVIYLSFMESIAELLGMNVKYSPLYGEFAGWLNENETIEEKWESLKNENLKVFDLARDENLVNLFNDLMATPRNWSYTDIKLINDYFDNVYYAVKSIPEVIPQKENKMTLCKMFIDKGLPLSQLNIDTATDVLRLAVSLSDGDISFASKCRFKKFDSKTRKVLLNLTKMVNPYSFYEDVSRYPEQWKRLNEILHITSNKKMPKHAQMMKKVCEGDLATSFMGKVDKCYKENDITTLLSLYMQRPGEFARGLHRILSHVNEKEVPIILASFMTVSQEIPVVTMLQLRTFFEAYHNVNKKYIYPKGNIASLFTIDAQKKLSVDVCEKTVKSIDYALIARFCKKEDMGNVYISEEFKHYYLPLNSRSASDTKRTFTRGSRFKVQKENEENGVLRAFIYWKGIDVDLSALFLDENYQPLNNISFTHLDEKYAKHSGDVRNAPKGASEFIDVDLNTLPKEYKYIAYTVHVFEGETYKNHEICYFGYMDRNKINSRKLYDPKDVKFKVDLNGDFYDETIAIYDVDNKEFIWVDMPVNYRRNTGLQRYATIENSKKGVASVAEAMINMNRPSLYDLISLNVQARGNLVENKEDADIVYDIEDGISPFDIDSILVECC